ncbi:MAG: HDOD domain-containing protein [Burkholderiales bacterium]|nr:HDOD domain-containing protein [Burkholderiales bacterium]
MATTTDEILQTELPARPAVLTRLGVEMQQEDPNFARVSELIGADVGLASAVVRIANSPYIGLGRRVSSVQQAVVYLGLSEVFGVVTGLLLRRSFKGGGAQMEQLWDLAAQRAGYMTWLARQLRAAHPDRAYTCGLFEDCGMAVLLLRSTAYAQSLPRLLGLADPRQTERQMHGLDHVMLSQALIRAWGLPDVIAVTVRSHHDLGGLESLRIDPEARTLVALSAFGNEAIRRQEGSHCDWPAHADQVARVLGLTVNDLEARLDEVPALAAAV